MPRIKGPAPNPCESCPYRCDVPSGVWHEDEYQKLVAYDRNTAEQPTALFQCHQVDLGSDQARLCAGWVGCHGTELLALRIGVATGEVSPDVLSYSTRIPLFASGAAARDHGIAEIDDPSPAAETVIQKISNNRPEVRLA